MKLPTVTSIAPTPPRLAERDHLRAWAAPPRTSTLTPVFGQIDHIGVAVEDLDDALDLYRDALGMRQQHRERLESQGVEAALVGVGDGHVELLEPLSPESNVGRFLARRGPGLHHVAYRTADIESAIGAMRAAGLDMIDEQPRGGVQGSRVAFVHPRATGGVLTELVEPAH